MTAAVTLAFALLIGLSSASAQTTSDEYTDARKLGGSTSFQKAPLTDASSVSQMASAPGMSADIRKVLDEGGVPEISDAVVATLSGATASVKGGSCSEATPQDGVLVECEVQPGATVEWMAYRPNVRRGDRAPGLLDRLRWAGNAPIPAFLFRVTDHDRIYTFILPKSCGNLSLLSVS